MLFATGMPGVFAEEEACTQLLKLITPSEGSCVSCVRSHAFSTISYMMSFSFFSFFTKRRSVGHATPCPQPSRAETHQALFRDRCWVGGQAHQQARTSLPLGQRYTEQTLSSRKVKIVTSSLPSNICAGEGHAANGSPGIIRKLWWIINL